MQPNERENPVEPTNERDRWMKASIYSIGALTAAGITLLATYAYYTPRMAEQYHRGFDQGYARAQEELKQAKTSKEQKPEEEKLQTTADTNRLLISGAQPYSVFETFLSHPNDFHYRLQPIDGQETNREFPLGFHPQAQQSVAPNSIVFLIPFEIMGTPEFMINSENPN